uniref:Uncharacterized protein LOC100179265 n=1 Tax=Phallusia mammillata TaxID=59560 RepID=A0A6F9DH76_9ASCI|nr:uncharacterized protein LOC100179265 [Phallusia mammillata]
MKQNRYDPLCHNDDVPIFPEDECDVTTGHCDVTSGDCDCDALIGDKKHGVWCTILTKLHLKKKHHHHNADDEKLKSHKKKRRITFASIRLKLKKQKYKQTIDDITNTDYDADKDVLVSLDKNSSSIPGESVSYRGRRVDIAILPNRYDLLEEVDFDLESTMNDSGIHDNSVCSSDEDDVSSNDVMIVDGENAKSTMSAYLRKQWNGQRAKRTRRSLRRGSSYTLKYLQTGLQTQNLVPNVSQIAVAFQKK